MLENLNEDWAGFLAHQLEQEYFQVLSKELVLEYDQQVVFPEKKDVFNAFNNCPLSKLKVVLVGQDPYHGKGQANGLSFSVTAGQKLPPSLKNIFKELKSDAGAAPNSGDLNYWANQGVLLLNTVLTVREGVANSHKNIGWQAFTKAVIQKIETEKSGVVFLLWGGNAHKFEKLIDAEKHCILKSGHPSPLSANRGFWFGNKHFSLTNSYPQSIGKSEIKW